ncbi:MAG: ATP-binding cassette domain-containing protein [Acidobacteriota bacterium]
MIEASGIRYSYSRQGFELKVGELKVEQGSSSVILGPSGSGKTTLLRLLSGIVVPQAGRLSIDGLEIPTLSESARRRFRQRRVGFVFQKFELLDYLSVRDNILLPYRLGGDLRLDDQVKARCLSLLDSVDLSEKADRKVTLLSEGERQRVAICRALIARPALVLADEPTGNLDSENAARAMQLLIDAAADNEATLLVVTHQEEFSALFQNVFRFLKGELL